MKLISWILSKLFPFRPEMPISEKLSAKLDGCSLGSCEVFLEELNRRKVKNENNTGKDLPTG